MSKTVARAIEDWLDQNLVGTELESKRRNELDKKERIFVK